MFRVGDLVTLKESFENKSYLDHLGEIGKVIDFHFSAGVPKKQFVRVEWSDKQYNDLKAERFEKVLRVY